MNELKIIESAKNGDAQALLDALSEGANIDQQDEQGWTALCWAAGKGDADMLKSLLENGADVCLSARDNRTPLMIAKAARRKEAVALLTDAEKRRGVWRDPLESRAYCRAYPLSHLRNWEGWRKSEIGDPSQAGGPSPDGEGGVDEIVYLHQDFTVTGSMWRGEDVIFDQVTPEWMAFCRSALAFSVPEDIL